MKFWLRLLLLLPAAVLIGCTLPSTSADSAPAGNWTNWQIQAGTAITSPPNAYPSFLGAIQVQGSQASGIFTTVNSTGTSAAEDYTGAFDTTTGDVSLTTFGFSFGFTQPATPYTPVPVGVTGGCVYPMGYTGPECLAIASIPSVGVQIASLTGTYAGTLTDSAAPGLSAAATLTLTQSPTPNSSGQFPLSGTIAFPGGSNLGTAPLAGTVTGEAIALNDPSAAPNSPTVNITASVDPSGSQITVSSLLYSNAGPGAVFIYSGTLIRQ